MGRACSVHTVNGNASKVIGNIPEAKRPVCISAYLEE
jgi:hypothetical protein